MIRVVIGWFIGAVIAVLIALFLLPRHAPMLGAFVGWACSMLGMAAGLFWDVKSGGR